MRKNLAKGHTPEAYRKAGATRKARGYRPPAAGKPWTPAEERLLGQLPDEEVCRLTGRTHSAVWSCRQKLGIPAWRSTKVKDRQAWRREARKLFALAGTLPARLLLRGRTLGLSDAEMAEAVDPPLGPGEVGEAIEQWRKRPSPG